MELKLRVSRIPMEAESPPNSLKLKKPNYSEEKGSNDRDMISSLHDSIIHYIMSFLDMKDVMQTSILAKRWRYLWKSLPILNFKYVYFPLIRRDRIRYGFVDFVDAVMSHRGQFNMHSFRISCGWCCDPARVNSWILAALKCKIEELHLSVFMVGPLEMPPCLFSCETLRVLKLETDLNEIMIPGYFYLPSLKTLHLISVLLGEKLILDVFSSCPVLEDLILENCPLNHIRVLNISSRKLKTLVIKPEKAPCTLYECKINISAPNLRSFSCRDFITRNYLLENPSALDMANIDLRIEERYVSEVEELPDERRKEYAHRMIRCLSSVQQAKTLRLSASLLEIVSEFPRNLHHLSSSFVNLRILKLESWLYRNCLWGIMCILKNSPNLEFLLLDLIEKNCVSYQNYQFLEEEMFDSALMEEEDWEEELKFQCTLYHLKHVEIRHLDGCINEYKLLRFLLKNAVSLMVMNLSATKRQTAKTEEAFAKIYERLQTFLPASENVEITFS